MKELALLGDSIFDNGAYVLGGPAVIDQVRDRLAADWQVTLLAVDGHVIQDVPGQLRKLARPADYAVISAGGNDALQHANILTRACAHAGEILAELAVIQHDFASRYARMLASIRAQIPRIAVCTIYDQIPLEPPDLRQIIVPALSIFNDAIIRQAMNHAVPVLDLRAICTDDDDFAAISPIEPSSHGGAKIASGITDLIQRHDFGRSETVLYG